MSFSLARFLIGFIVSLFFFLAVSLLAAHLQSDCGLPGLLQISGCADDIRRAGFPLVFYESGGFAYRNNFSLVALVIDVVCGVGLSVLGGMLIQRLWKQAR